MTAVGSTDYSSQQTLRIVGTEIQEKVKLQKIGSGGGHCAVLEIELMEGLQLWIITRSV